MKIKTVFILFISFLSQISFCAPTVEDFLKEQELFDSVISPDGNHLAQLWNKDGIRTVTVRDLQKPNQPIVGQVSDKITRAQAISWANNDRLLMTVWLPFDTSYAEIRSRTKKDFDVDDYVAAAKLISVDVNLKNGVVLLDDRRTIRSNSNLANAHHLSKDPNHVAILVNDDGLLTLFKADIYSGKSEKIITAGTHTFAVIVDAYGNPLYRLDYLPMAKQVVIFEKTEKDNWNKIDSIRLNELENESLLKDADLVSLSENDLIYRKRNEDTGYYELVKYKSKEKKFETFVSLKDQDVISPITSRYSQDIVGYTVDGDHIRHRYFDQEKQKTYDQLESKLKDYEFDITSRTSDGKKAVLEVSGADNPLSFYLYNFDNGELKPIANAFSAISVGNLSSSAIANYTTRDGQKIHSYLLFPPNYESGKKYPLIVMPHGGPQARDRADFDSFAQFLSTRGYVVIKPNFRGSSGFGKNFEQAGYKQWGQLMQDDVDDAVSFMIRKGFADPKKVCILGFSYGGYSALMGAIKRPDLYACAVSINGVTHLRDMIESDKKDVDDPVIFDKYWIQRIGDPATERKMLDENSPALQAEKISIPLLIIGSEKDRIVPFSQAKTMVKALEKNGKKYTFITLEKSGHTPFYDKKDSETVHREVEKFLEAQLKQETPNP